MYKVGVLTLSDKGAAGEREDLSGPAIKEILKNHENFRVSKTLILPDEKDKIVEEMIRMCDQEDIDLILTTGGTGFSKRDITPEATHEVIERKVPGIPEAMRYFSLQITPRAMLSRGEAGIRGKALIVNMPGSPKAVKEVLEYILPSIEHGLDILQGNTSECARN